MSPEERHLRIEEEYQQAMAMKNRVDALSTYLNLGFPVRTALKLSSIKLSEEDIKTVEKNRKKK